MMTIKHTALKAMKVTTILFLVLGIAQAFAPPAPCRRHERITGTTQRPRLQVILAESKTESPPALSTTAEVDLCTIEGSFCEPSQVVEVELEGEERSDGFSYADFARNNPFVNNVAIATCKTAAADLIAQVAIAQTPIDAVDWERSLLFCAFGAIYLGGFQYLYQVQVFKRLFDVDSFTSQPWADKLRDGPGLRALAAQTALDLTVLTFIYLPTFYVFKAGVFSGSLDPAVWADTGLDSYKTNFAKDEFDLIRVWLPADLVCFSVPLYLRLPVRHIVSFVWTAYLSFARGGH